MIRFECDYNTGAHPAILQRLLETNEEQTPGYGEDPYCESAREKIRALCQNETVDVHFLMGGTQTNLTVIAAVLRPWQGVLCADTGHINVHESGAIEATGHKVLPLPSRNGKISAGQVQAALEAHWKDENHEHTVQPGMVFLAYPTENGTLYSREELTALSDVCRRFHLPLYLDGARLGYGLAANDGDLSLADLTKLCDVFYIGGTKIGALFGEAVVISSDTLKPDFRYLIKQRGGMLAKGRLLGLQFDTLLEGDRYGTISRHAVRLARMIHDAFAQKGISFLYPSPTNQQFPILSKGQQAFLSRKYAFCPWEPVDENHDAVRFCTSWSTREEDVQALLADIAQMECP